MSPIRIPYDSNLRYLPLVYFLPEDVIAKHPTICHLPRKIREVVYSDIMMEVVNSDQFLDEIMHAWSALVFPYFGFRGWKEDYGGYFPAWELAYALPVYCRVLEAETGWNLQTLMNIPSFQSIPYFDTELIKYIIEKVVQRAIEEEGWQPIFDTIQEFPCEEDFERRYTNVRKDFIKKWYHTRTKTKMMSLEACIEDEDGHIHEIEDVSAAFEDNVIAEDYCNRFKATLSDRDMEILKLRVEGFTYEEIARRLGYKNHSGVLKRMNTIKKRLIEYESKYGQ